MESLADWIKSQTADYGQLKEAYPFDPLRKNSSSLLASLLGGTALVGQYNKEKKMKEMR